MAGEWYCQIRGRQTGPLSNEQLQQLADEQTIGPDNLVRSGRDGSWMPARRVEGLFTADQSAASASRSAVALKTASPLSGGGSAPRRAAPTNGGSASARVPPPARSGAVPPAPAWAPSQAAPVAPKPTPVPMTGGGTSPDAAVAGEAHPDSLPAPRSGSVGKIIAIVLVSVFGVVALLCGGGIAIGYALIMRADALRKEVAAKIEEEMEKDRRQRDAELEQIGADLQNDGRDDTGDASQPLERRAIAQVKKWHPANVRVRSGRLVFEVVSVQLVSPRGPEGAAQEFGDGRVVLVEVSVGNVGRDPVDFISWSRGGRTSEDHRAVLVDDQERVCSPVNELGEKAESLLAQDQPIESGAAVTDLLVFEAPQGSPDQLRLALPYGNVGRNGYIGFAIPREMLKPGSADAAADGAVSTAIPGAGDPAVPEQPPTLEDLQKAIGASRDRK